MPEHEPPRYFPLAQFAFEQVEHEKPLVVPLQLPLRYFPPAQLMLPQAEHTVSDAPEQPPLLYLPVPHVAQAEHPYPLLVPEHEPLRYFPLPQFELEHVLHE